MLLLIYHVIKAITSQIETSDIVNADILEVEQEDIYYPNLPSYKKDEMFPHKSWIGHSGEEFSRMINKIYDEIVQWLNNLFKLPSGEAALNFISELTLWLDHFNRGTEFRSIA